MARMPGYQQTLIELKTEIAELITQRQRIDDRLASLKQAIDSLNALRQGGRPKSDESAASTKGQISGSLGEKICDVLHRAGAPLSPTEIRDRLVSEAQVNPANYSNFLAVVHTTLHRLVVSRHIGFLEVAGKTVYLHLERKDKL